MTKLRNILTFCLIFFSCHHQPPNPYLHLIVGDWTCIKQNRLPDSTDNFSYPNFRQGYSFLPSGVCQNKLGFFKDVITKISGLENAYGPRSEKTTTYFLGTQTEYKIVNDSLKIFNLTDSTWEVYKILKISSDSLILQKKNNSVVKFIKSNYSIKKDISFDEIVVSSSGCYGTCPISNTLINKLGKVTYYGENYNNQNGLYTFSLPKKDYDQIISNFKNADINNLKDKYQATWTDDEEITVTFFKDKKIIKTISDYGHVAPTELYWAYTPVRYLYQFAKLDTENSVNIQLNQVRVIIFEFGWEFGLRQSEAFYLCNLLEQAKETHEIFSKKYQLKFHGLENIEKIETDGRYFTLTMLNGTQKTFDIGFNFLEVNSLTNKLTQNKNIQVSK